MSCRLRPTWLAASYRFIQLAMVFSSRKRRAADVFIAAENVGTGMHGDRVVARISPEPPAGRIKGRREGRVIRNP